MREARLVQYEWASAWRVWGSKAPLGTGAPGKGGAVAQVPARPRSLAELAAGQGARQASPHRLRMRRRRKLRRKCTPQPLARASAAKPALLMHDQRADAPTRVWGWEFRGEKSCAHR
jgi:hypothetical protein